MREISLLAGLFQPKACVARLFKDGIAFLSKGLYKSND